MKTDKADERMNKSLDALQAFDLAIKDLIALDAHQDNEDPNTLYAW